MDLSVKAKEINSKGKYLKMNYLSTKGDGLRYIRYRILRPLLKLYTHWGRRKYRPAPWLTPPAIEIFDTILTTNMTGLEYGSGRSTLFFSSRLRHLTSVEHNRDWYEKVRELTVGLDNVELTLIEPDSQSLDKRDFGIEGFVPKSKYESYYNFVCDFEDASFDFILIDGRARVECCINSLPKLKSGGILAVDNSERDRYQPIFTILKDWQKVETTNGLTNTTIWFKP